MLCLGIDLTASPKRASATAILDENGALVQLSSFKTYKELVALLATHPPDVIGIDAPLGLPQGIHCLDQSCPCAPTNGHKGRMAEVEIAKMGIACFYTGKKSIIRPLIYRAIKLRNGLRRRGFNLVEAYPYATKVLLFGDGLPPKRRPESLTHLRRHLPELVSGMDDHVEKLNHDRSDAILTAYTAYLHLRGDADQLGIPEEGLITIPKLQGRNGPVSTRRQRLSAA